MSDYFHELIKEYHQTRLEYKKNENNKEKLIALTLALAQFYYEKNEMYKAKHHLKEVLELDGKVENVHTYFGLIALYEGENSIAMNEIKEEIKLFPKNNFAQNLYEKIHVSSIFPIINTLLIFIFLIISYKLSFELNTTNLVKYGLNINTFNITNILSSIFIHINLTHLILNLSVLILLGHLVEKYLGHSKYILIFLISAIIGNMTQVLFNLENSYVVGASAGIFGLLGALLMRTPMLTTKIFGVIRVPLILILGILFAISLLVPNNFMNSAEIAHVIGLFCGIFITSFLYPKNIRVFYNWVAISFGFLILINSLNVVFESYKILQNLILNVILIIIGLFLIIYGYYTLQKYFYLREESENILNNIKEDKNE